MSVQLLTIHSTEGEPSQQVIETWYNTTTLEQSSHEKADGMATRGETLGAQLPAWAGHAWSVDNVEALALNDNGGGSFLVPSRAQDIIGHGAGMK